MGRRAGREFVPGAYNCKRRKGQGRRKYAKRLRKGPEDALRCNGDEFAVGKDTWQAEKVRNRDGDTSSTPQSCKCVICRTVKPAARRRVIAVSTSGGGDITRAPQSQHRNLDNMCTI